MDTTRIDSAHAPRRVVLLGWDAADWQMIDPLVRAGAMPTLAALRERGTWGNLSTTQPILSPILWNSIATGRRPDCHGVLGFTEPVPDGSGVRAVASTSRRCKALWNILTQSDLRSHVVGWYASHPAEPINGVMVSNQIGFERASDGPLAPLPVGSVHPSEMAEELAACRVHPGEIDAEAILPFIPDAARVVEREGHRVGKLQHLLAHTATTHALSMQLAMRDDWQFLAVYHEGIDRFGHEFMEFHPPRMEQVTQDDFEAYRHCMAGIYRFHDMMLDAMLQVVGDDTAVIVMSDHGYWNDHRRPDPREGRAGPVDWHRPYGVFAAAGPGVRKQGRLFGGSILDVTPTVLTLLGLPAARDMPGRVLAEALDGVTIPERIPSWEARPGSCGMHPPEMRIDPAESRAALEQLVALGYIEPIGEDDAKARRETESSNQFQLAHAHAYAGEPAKALEAFARVETSMQETPAGRLLEASCLLALGRLDDLRVAIDRMIGSGLRVPQVGLLRASLDAAEGRPDLAIARLSDLQKAGVRGVGLHARLGELRLERGLLKEAERDFLEALALEPESASALSGLAVVRLRLGDPRAALDHGLAATALEYGATRAHHAVGAALLELGDAMGAVEALRVCVTQAPGWRDGRLSLAAALRAIGLSEEAQRIEADAGVVD
jgi:predicted AlkP superfamily phosphohydrolase/phosphomutase/tetratricopeptide (TPR) repeat protein